jgi:hypothetical protein
MIQTLKKKTKMMIMISLTTMITFYQRKKISKRRSMSILKLVKLKEDIKENILDYISEKNTNISSVQMFKKN